MLPQDIPALANTSYDFYRPRGSNLESRLSDYGDWAVLRQERGLYQYARVLAGKPGPTTAVYDEHTDGKIQAKIVNFSSQDYLSLATHPEISAAAIRAIHEFGVHSAGSPMIIGNTRLSKELEAELGDFLRAKHVIIYPTGYAAGFGAIVGLVRSYDHIVMDRLTHACLQQGAVAATQNIVKHTHLDPEAASRELRKIRASDPRGGILVVSEGLFSMDADSPDLGRLQEVCHENNATLLVDVAHDLGSTGPGGTGQIGRQGLRGKIDVVMGSFSKTFASNGGFVATNSRAVYEYLRMYSSSYMFSNALSPVQTAIVQKALQIVRSPEGDERRRRLTENILALRARFAHHGIRCYGQASPIVPVAIGTEAKARLVHRLLPERQVAASVIEFPIVPLGEARFRMQVMSDHTEDEAIYAADHIAAALGEVR